VPQLETELQALDQALVVWLARPSK
jgi:hypothetical protein